MGCVVKRKLPSPNSVVKVGDGRGFVVSDSVRVDPIFSGRKRAIFMERRLVLTAAHCLPQLPPAHAGAYEADRTYPRLIRTLDGRIKDVWAECLFANPVADIAVLGCPDTQDLGDEAAAYDELTESVPSVRIGKARSGPGWILSLDSRWTSTPLNVSSGLYGTSLSIGPTNAGMSGSPILNDGGRAVGIVVVGTEVGGRPRKLNGPQPILMRDLPCWLVDSLAR